ncbi:MAG: hypothetical protein Alis3KO_06630 [Aliiglaciecola sp.]
MFTQFKTLLSQRAIVDIVVTDFGTSKAGKDSEPDMEVVYQMLLKNYPPKS